MDFFDFILDFELNKINQIKAKNMNSTGLYTRNATMTDAEQPEFVTAFKTLRTNLDEFINFLMTNYGNQANTLSYDTKNIYVAITQVNPNFNSTNFFSTRMANYESWVEFMQCINEIMIVRLNNPYYQIWMVFIDYKVNPNIMDAKQYYENVSPYVSLKFYQFDGTVIKDIIVVGCDSLPMNFHLPVKTYLALDKINPQYELFYPEYSYPPNSPIFSQPLYINASGYISNDTVFQRLEKWHRKNNFSGTYYNTDSKVYLTDGIVFKNLSDNFIVLNVSHLSEFVTNMIVNPQNYQIEDNFFYLKFPYILLYLPNYTNNYGFYVIVGLLSYFFLTLFITTCYDIKYYSQEGMLKFIKKSVIHSISPYDEEDEEENPEDENDLPFPPDFDINNNDPNVNEPIADNLFGNVQPIKVRVKKDKKDSQKSSEENIDSQRSSYNEKEYSDGDEEESQEGEDNTDRDGEVKVEDYNDLFGLGPGEKVPKESGAGKKENTDRSTVITKKINQDVVVNTIDNKKVIAIEVKRKVEDVPKATGAGKSDDEFDINNFDDNFGLDLPQTDKKDKKDKKDKNKKDKNKRLEKETELKDTTIASFTSGNKEKKKTTVSSTTSGINKRDIKIKNPKIDINSVISEEEELDRNNAMTLESSKNTMGTNNDLIKKDKKDKKNKSRFAPVLDSGNNLRLGGVGHTQPDENNYIASVDVDNSKRKFIFLFNLTIYV